MVTVWSDGCVNQPECGNHSMIYVYIYSKLSCCTPYIYRIVFVIIFQQSWKKKLVTLPLSEGDTPSPYSHLLMQSVQQQITQSCCQKLLPTPTPPPPFSSPSSSFFFLTCFYFSVDSSRLPPFIFNLMWTSAL